MTAKRPIDDLLEAHAEMIAAQVKFKDLQDKLFKPCEPFFKQQTKELKKLERAIKLFCSN